MIVGVDEVGRGSLAGPVCVGAVVQHDGLTGLADDSKKLLPSQREAIAAAVKQLTLVSLGWASAAYIDAYGLTAALRLAARQALAGLGVPINQVLLDGNHNYIGDRRVTTIIDGDAQYPVIGAASIMAKVARDSYMKSFHARFPAYGFLTHVGYGTPAHRAALASAGPCAIHRMSFAPLKALSGKPVSVN